MSDLFQGQTMTEWYRFISAGTAHTFTFNFQPDKVVFVNITKWAATAGGDPISVWYRDDPLEIAAKAYQQTVIDSAAAQSFNFKLAATNGFTNADTSGGATAYRASINAISMVDPVAVTTTSAHGYQSGQIVRITKLGDAGAVDYGADQLNNNRYKITVTGSTTFTLQDPVTGDDVDGTGYTAYASGGFVNLESRVITLNNPQITPATYTPTPFTYDPIEYKLTAGTDVMQSDNDQFIIEVYKFGQFTQLGDLLT